MSLLATLIAKDSYVVAVLCQRFTTIVKQVKFEGVWGNSQARKCFQKQLSAKYLKQTVFFM